VPKVRPDVRKSRLTFINTIIKWSRDSSVGSVAGYWLECPGSIPGQCTIFLFSIASRPVLGPTQPPIRCVPGGKWQEREADHSPPSSAEVSKGRAIPPQPHTS
jgi:hypothetical protein